MNPNSPNWLLLCASLDFAAPELHYEIVDDETGQVLAQADAAWPSGLQEELSEPAAFLLESDQHMEARLGELGYRFFTDRVKFDQYLETLTGLDLDGDGVIGFTDEIHTIAGETSLPSDSSVSSSARSATVDGLPAEIRSFVEERTPTSEVQFRTEYLRRCIQELGLEVRAPKGSARPYLNVYPAAAGSIGRVAAIRPSSGRIAILVSPTAAADYPNAEVVRHHGDPVYVKVYARSNQAVDDAIALTRRALDR
jgi:hypothetical protein